jgi:two-component system sensor histidine kinase DesK
MVPSLAWAVPWAAALIAPAAVQAGGTAQPALILLGLTTVGVLFVLAVALAAQSARGHSRAALVLLTGQAVVTALVATTPDLPWGTLAILLAISVGGVVRSLWSPALVVLVAAAATVVLHSQGTTWSNAFWETGFSTLLAGLLTYAFSRLMAVIVELRRTREELARAAVSQERLRFSRDLHDLLGHTLSVIVVKAQLVRRSVHADPEAAAAHAADIEAVGRQLLTEVRQAVKGYRQATLDEELQRATEMLQAAGVTTEVVRRGTALTSEQEDVLAWVVREGATNVVRHAHARSARITTDNSAGRVHLRVEDDGVGAGVDGHEGSGLAGLRERLAEVGGSLHARAGQPGFQLTAVLPGTPDLEAR